MRKRLILTLLPIIGLVSLIGAGYSIFIFTENYSTSSNLQDGISIGDFQDEVSVGNVLVYGGIDANDNEGSHTGTKLIFDKKRTDSDGNTIGGIHLENNDESYDCRTEAYYLFTKSEDVAYCINYDYKEDKTTKFTGYYRYNRVITGGSNNEETENKECYVDAKKDSQYTFIKGKTNIKFTVQLQVPIELGQYICLQYNGENKNASEGSYGWDEVVYTMDNSGKCWNIRYQYSAYYTDLDPTYTYFDELYNEDESLTKYVNHEYKTKFSDTSNPKAKFGFKFFDWKDVTISEYDSDGINSNDTSQIKAIHKKAPTTYDEYVEMINTLTNTYGKAGLEYYGNYLGIGCKYIVSVEQLN